MDAESKPEAKPEKRVLTEDEKRAIAQAAEKKAVQATMAFCQDLIGKADPDLKALCLLILPQIKPDAWLKGAEYVMGAIAHRAFAVLAERAKDKVRTLEVKTARDRGPLVEQTRKASFEFQRNKEADLSRLQREKKQAIQDLTTQVNLEYAEKLKAVETRPAPEALAVLQDKLLDLDKAFEDGKGMVFLESEDTAVRLRALVEKAKTPPPKPKRVKDPEPKPETPAAG